MDGHLKVPVLSILLTPRVPYNPVLHSVLDVPTYNGNSMVRSRRALLWEVLVVEDSGLVKLQDISIQGDSEGTSLKGNLHTVGITFLDHVKSLEDVLVGQFFIVKTSGICLFGEGVVLSGHDTVVLDVRHSCMDVASSATIVPIGLGAVDALLVRKFYQFSSHFVVETLNGSGCCKGVAASAALLVSDGVHMAEFVPVNRDRGYCWGRLRSRLFEVLFHLKLFNLGGLVWVS